MMPLLVLLFSLMSLDQEDAGVKIVGGEAAAPGEFPYQVFVEKIWNSTKIYKCGGAVYNKDFIITAAHCLFFKDMGYFAKPHKIWITAGTHDLVSMDDEVLSFEQVSWGVEMIPHPLFQYYNHTFPIYDIALLKLNKSLKWTSRVQPIPLPNNNFRIMGNGTVTGWGRLDPTGRWTRQLQKVEIPLLEWEECAKVFKKAANVTKDMFCTGSKKANLIPCKGDSGTAVACWDNTTKPPHRVLCGIASFGAKNCSHFSIYTRVTSYLDWISSVAGPPSTLQSTI